MEDAGRGTERSALARTKDEDGAEVKDSPPVLALQSQSTQDLNLEQKPLLKNKEKESVSLDASLAEKEEDEVPLEIQMKRLIIDEKQPDVCQGGSMVQGDPEDMPLPTVFDFLHKDKKSFDFENLVRVAIEIVESMQYLHQENIFYGGLETKSLLIDEKGVVKICGPSHLGGKINWDVKAVKSDILHFGVVLWEMMTVEIPVEAARKVLKQKISDGFERTWKENPPSYEEIMKSTTDLLLERIPSDAHPILVVIIKRCLDSYDTITFKGIGELLRKITKVEKKRLSRVPCF